MPTYDYICVKCTSQFSDVKSISDYSVNAEAKCPYCGHMCDANSRDFSKARPQFIGTKVQDAEYNPGLGRVIKNKRQLDYVCKEKNVVEVGNDYSTGEGMQTTFEKRKKEELEKSWEI